MSRGVSYVPRPRPNVDSASQSSLTKWTLVAMSRLAFLAKIGVGAGVGKGEGAAVGDGLVGVGVGGDDVGEAVGRPVTVGEAEGGDDGDDVGHAVGCAGMTTTMPGPCATSISPSAVSTWRRCRRGTCTDPVTGVTDSTCTRSALRNCDRPAIPTRYPRSTVALKSCRRMPVRRTVKNTSISVTKGMVGAGVGTLAGEEDCELRAVGCGATKAKTHHRWQWRWHLRETREGGGEKKSRRGVPISNLQAPEEQEREAQLPTNSPSLARPTVRVRAKWSASRLDTLWKG